MVGRALPVVAAVAALAACGDGRGRVGRDLEVWEVPPTPVAAIGGADERENYALFGPTGAARLADGRIAILNSGSHEVRFYDADGTYRSSVGGEGQGPGELFVIRAWGRLRGDTLLILSRYPGLTWISSDEEIVRQERFDFTPFQMTCRLAEGGYGVLRDGSILLRQDDNFAPAYCPSAPLGRWRQSGLVTRFVPGVAGHDTIDLLPGTERNDRHYAAYGLDLLVGIGEARVYLADHRGGLDRLLQLRRGGSPSDRDALRIRGDSSLSEDRACPRIDR